MTSNLLVIMSDEHQSRAMGCAGHPFVKTPNLDRLAARGMRFTNAYTPSPICVPARAAFATGRYVHQNRLWDNAMPYTGDPLGWGHALQAKDIPVESIGKLHYRDADDDAGFDVEHIPMQVVDGVGMVWASIRAEGERVKLAKGRMLGPEIGPGSSKYTEYDASVTACTLEWLKDAPEEPWCLYVGLVAPHFPLVVPQEFYDLYPLDSLPEVKLHPSYGYQRHPWVEKQNAMMDSESKFESPEERLSAMAAYYGLCSYLDHNIGQILDAVGEDTAVIYTSDHGDNVGARGLWGKSNFYEESVAVPMIMAGPSIAPGECATPVSILDVSSTIAQHFGVEIDGVGRSLLEMPDDPERVVFSEYHAAGAVSGGYMLRRGRWKLIYYVGFEPELFDLEADPEELVDVAAERQDIVAELEAELRKICDPEAVDKQAFADQAALIASFGGREAALKLGAPGATPPPKV